MATKLQLNTGREKPQTMATERQSTEYREKQAQAKVNKATIG